MSYSDILCDLYDTPLFLSSSILRFLHFFWGGRLSIGCHQVWQSVPSVWQNAGVQTKELRSALFEKAK